MYCGHCINTSPNLLAKLKVEQLMLRESNAKLKNKVEAILEYGLAQVDAIENHRSDKTQRIESSNVEGEILGQRLLKLSLLSSKRKNSRIKYRTTQLASRLKEKRDKVEELQRELTSRSEVAPNNERAFANIKASVSTDWTHQMDQIARLISQSQQSKLMSLRKWFVVRKRDSYEFPFSVAFLPIVSLKNFYKLPPSVAWGSIQKMSQYMTMMAEILFYTLPYKIEAIPDLAGYEKEQGQEGNDANAAEYLTKLVVNAIQLARHLNLASRNPIDLAWVLDQHDLDILFYNMATETKITTRPVAQHWTFSRVLSVVSDALQLSVYATSPASRQTLNGTRVNNSDLWSLVG